MSARKQQQRRLPRQAALQPIIYKEDDSNGQPDSKRVRAPELDTCLEVVTSTLSNPNRALLRRVFFIAKDTSKFVSVGYYPARGYQPLAEITLRFSLSTLILPNPSRNSCKI